MKPVNKFLRTVCICLALLLCVTALPVTTYAAQVPKLSKTKATMYTGTALILKVKNTTQTVTWKSTKKSVATVNAKGKVTAKKAGKTTIIAKTTNKTFKCKITVKKPKLNKTKLTLTVGTSAKLKLNGPKVKTWKSDQKRIATVSKSGKVVAKSAGKTRITAITKDKKNYSCIVTVKTKLVAQLQPKPHKHIYELKETIPATCNTHEIQTFTCKTCKDTYVTTNETTPLADHTYKSVQKPATCTAHETMIYTCSVCNASYKEVHTNTPLASHNFQLVQTTPATCMSYEVNTYKCTNCGITYSETNESALANHVFVDHTCTLCGKREAGYYTATHYYSWDMLDLNLNIDYNPSQTNNTANYTANDMTKSISNTTPGEKLAALNETGELVIADDVSNIGIASFSDCEQLTSVVIPPSVTKISRYAFKNCKNLTAVAYEDNNVTCLDDYAFYNCPLIDIEIGTKVTLIGERCFAGHAPVKDIIVPDSVTQIGYAAFGEDGTSVQNLYLDANIPVICLADLSQGIEHAIIGTHIQTLQKSKYDVTTAQTTLKSLTTTKRSTTDPSLTIDTSAFCGYTALQSVSICNKLKTVGEDAFKGCTNLTDFIVSNDDSAASTINTAAFQECKNLTTFDVWSGITTLGDRAFYLCENLKTITLPDTLTTIGSQAFYHTGITSISIPSSVTSIGSNAPLFSTATLKQLELPMGLASMPSMLIYGCTGLETIIMDRNTQKTNSDILAVAPNVHILYWQNINK